MSLLAVRRALETALDNALSIDLAFENVPYEPTEGTPYARVYLLAAEPDNLEMGALITEQGFLQVTLCYPLGAGSSAAMTAAETIRSTFPRGASFTASGVVTTIEKTPEIGPAMIEEDRFCLPVRCRFYSHH